MRDRVGDKGWGEMVLEDGLLSDMGDDLMFREQFGDGVMEVDMVMEIGEGWFDGGDEGELVMI